MSDSSHTPARVTGVFLVAGAAVSLFLMMQHPTLGTPGFHSLAEEVEHESSINQFVHGAMILIMLVYMFGMQQLGRLIGESRWQVTAGLIAFALATAMMILAPLMSGFLITQLAQSFAAAPDGGGETFRSLIALSHAMNQVFANTGVVAYGAGMALFALPLIAAGGLQRIAGLAGVPIGITLMVGILSGHLHLDVHGMMAAAAGMGIWFGLAGAVLMQTPHAPSPSDT